MDIRELEYLIVLAEEGNVSKAAARLFMAQSSLSQFLQQYETELGVKLFVRSSRGIRPTHSGEIYIQRMRRLLAEYQRAKNELWDNENLNGGKVALGISSFRGRRLLPRILLRFQERYPNVQVEIVEEHSMRLEELLLEGRLDLAVVAMPPSKLKSQTAFLKKDEILIVANRSHPVLAAAQPTGEGDGLWVELKDAARYEFILSGYNTMLGSKSRSFFQKEGLTCKAIHEDISAAMAVAMASEGLGLAFTYSSYAEPQDETVFLRIGREGVFLDLGLAFPAGEYRSKAASALEQVVREIYQTA